MQKPHIIYEIVMERKSILKWTPYYMTFPEIMDVF